MTPRTAVISLVAAVAFLIAYSSVYVVKETEKAVVLQFGRLVAADVGPGLHFKWPIVNSVGTFDARLLTVDASPENFYTVQKKRLRVDSFVKYRILDVEQYYRATGGIEQVAFDRLEARINDGLRNKFGKRTLHEVVSGQRDELMHEMTAELNEAVNSSLGIEVVDVRVKRIDLPEEASESVFKRMAAEREKEASEYRAEGREEAEKIRADADRQKVILEAEAYREAEQIRGDGDARSAAIYASVYGKDPEFYSFVRSLKAYQASFADKGDLMVIDPNSDYFRYLKASKPK